MLNNLGDIYNYCNDALLDGELSDIYDIINYLEEAQNLISELSEIEAPLVSVVLDSECKITLPSDFLKLNKFEINNPNDVYQVQPIKEWAGKVYFNLLLIGSTLDIYYYKRPTPLVATNLLQIPDLDNRYFYSMAQYAAEMYKLKDDDVEMQKMFGQKFGSNLIIYSRNKGITTKIKNLW